MNKYTDSHGTYICDSTEGGVVALEISLARESVEEFRQFAIEEGSLNHACVEHKWHQCWPSASVTKVGQKLAFTEELEIEIHLIWVCTHKTQVHTH